MTEDAAFILVLAIVAIPVIAAAIGSEMAPARKPRRPLDEVRVDAEGRARTPDGRFARRPATREPIHG